MKALLFGAICWLLIINSIEAYPASSSFISPSDVPLRLIQRLLQGLKGALESIKSSVSDTEVTSSEEERQKNAKQPITLHLSHNEIRSILDLLKFFRMEKQTTEITPKISTTEIPRVYTERPVESSTEITLTPTTTIDEIKTDATQIIDHSGVSTQTEDVVMSTTKDLGTSTEKEEHDLETTTESQVTKEKTSQPYEHGTTEKQYVVMTDQPRDEETMQEIKESKDIRTSPPDVSTSEDMESKHEHTTPSHVYEQELYEKTTEYVDEKIIPDIKTDPSIDIHDYSSKASTESTVTSEETTTEVRLPEKPTTIEQEAVPDTHTNKTLPQEEELTPEELFEKALQEEMKRDKYERTTESSHEGGDTVPRIHSEDIPDEQPLLPISESVSPEDEATTHATESNILAENEPSIPENITEETYTSEKDEKSLEISTPAIESDEVSSIKHVDVTTVTPEKQSDIYDPTAHTEQPEDDLTHPYTRTQDTTDEGELDKITSTTSPIVVEESGKQFTQTHESNTTTESVIEKELETLDQTKVEDTEEHTKLIESADAKITEKPKHESEEAIYDTSEDEEILESSEIIEGSEETSQEWSESSSKKSGESLSGDEWTEDSDEKSESSSFELTEEIEEKSEAPLPSFEIFEDSDEESHVTTSDLVPTKDLEASVSGETIPKELGKESDSSEETSDVFEDSEEILDTSTTDLGVTEDLETSDLDKTTPKDTEKESGSLETITDEFEGSDDVSEVTTDSDLPEKTSEVIPDMIEDSEEILDTSTTYLGVTEDLETSDLDETTPKDTEKESGSLETITDEFEGSDDVSEVTTDSDLPEKTSEVIPNIIEDSEEILDTSTTDLGVTEELEISDSDKTTPKDTEKESESLETISDEFEGLSNTPEVSTDSDLTEETSEALPEDSEEILDTSTTGLGVTEDLEISDLDETTPKVLEKESGSLETITDEFEGSGDASDVFTESGQLGDLEGTESSGDLDEESETLSPDSNMYEGSGDKLDVSTTDMELIGDLEASVSGDKSPEDLDKQSESTSSEEKPCMEVQKEATVVLRTPNPLFVHLQQAEGCSGLRDDQLLHLSLFTTVEGVYTVYLGGTGTSCDNEWGMAGAKELTTIEVHKENIGIASILSPIDSLEEENGTTVFVVLNHSNQTFCEMLIADYRTN